MDIISAIGDLYPQVVRTVGTQAYDIDGNEVFYDLTAVETYIASNEYKTKRALEYPTIGDQLDALWKGGDAATAMLAQVQAVKAKYPKGTV